MFNNLVKDLFKEADNNRFKDFITKRITLAYYGAFIAGRKFNLNSRLNNSKLKLSRIYNIRLYRKNLLPLYKLF